MTEAPASLADFDFKTTPYAHQLKALESSWDRRAYALLMEMGTGKTKVMIDTISLLYSTQEIDSVLILAPKGVYKNWINREIPVHLIDSVNDDMMAADWISGLPKRFEKQLSELKEHKGLRVLAMNIEAIRNMKGKGFKVADWFVRLGNCLVIIDESTCIKTPNSQQTKAAIALGHAAKYRRILTGSPVTNSPLDLFSQFFFLNPQIMGFKSFFAFRNRYAVMESKEFGGRKIQIPVAPKNIPELKDKIAPHSYRVTKDECLDLPAKIYTTRSVEMSKAQQRIYRDMKEYATSELADGSFVTATELLTRMLRLHQIACGFTVDEEGVLQRIENGRLDALKETVDELPPDHSAIIWSHFRHCLSDISAFLRKTYGEESVVEYWGDTSREDRELAIERFQSGQARFFVGNPQTAGYGITLTKARAVIYYSNSFRLDERMQSEDRAHRIGQEHPVTYVDLLAEETIDVRVVQALRKKIDIATAVTGDDYRQWLI